MAAKAAARILLNFSTSMSSPKFIFSGGAATRGGRTVPTNGPAHWRQRAQEIRTLADDMCDSGIPIDSAYLCATKAHLFYSILAGLFAIDISGCENWLRSWLEFSSSANEFVRLTID
jgi:hypothetical protein